MNKCRDERKYSLTDEEYEFLKQHFQKDELLWKYKRALEEADEEKEEKIKYREQVAKLKERISELESGLSARENLLKTQNELQGKEIEKNQREINCLKEQIQCNKYAIMQIDDVLVEFFGVTHEIMDKPSDFEKVLQVTIDKSKTIADFLPTEPIKATDMLINAEAEYETNSIQRSGKKGKYNIFSVSDLRQIAEHLLVYCNHNSEDTED